MKSKISKLFVNFEKEEKWLNEMASKGLNLLYYTFPNYIFEDGNPGEYIYRLELLEHSANHPESRAYIKFMEETGVEFVASHLSWVYFRKKASEGSFDLYSDRDSKIRHYKRAASLLGLIGTMNLVIALFNLGLGLYNGYTRGSVFYFNAWVSSINWLIVVTFFPVYFYYLKKIKQLKQEKDIFE